MSTNYVYAYSKHYLDAYGGSMHLAAWRYNCIKPLNSGFGVLSAEADFTEGGLVGTTKILKRPWLFRLQDGSFGVIALRLNLDKRTGLGCEELVKKSHILFYTSPDLLTYSPGKLCLLTDEELLLEDISCSWIEHRYVVLVQTNKGLKRFETVDFCCFTQVEVSNNDSIVRTAIAVEDADEACQLSITDREMIVLQNRLFPLENVGVEDVCIQLQAGQSLQLPQARLKYHDGSFFEMPVCWESFEETTPGEYAVSGTICPEHWPFPLMPERGDPVAIQYEGHYYFMATDDEHGQRMLKIRRTDTLASVASAEDHVILSANDSGERSGCFWAPELHKIGDRLFLFFACGSPHWYTVQSHVMELIGNDPLNANHWSMPMRCKKKDGDNLIDDGITLDMTVLNLPCGSYAIWAQRMMHMEENEMGSSDLYIAQIDPQKPWQQISESALLRQCLFSWERIGTEVLEGPFVLRRQNTVYLTYAAALIDHTYCVGMMQIAESSDPLDMASWQTNSYPLVHRYSVPTQIGAGHNSFVQDGYGNDLLMIHAIPMQHYLSNPKDTRRYPAFRRVHWDRSGFPRLDMHPQRELLPQFKQITARVVVR